jgi:hypothetical protein
MVLSSAKAGVRIEIDTLQLLLAPAATQLPIARSTESRDRLISGVSLHSYCYHFQSLIPRSGLSEKRWCNKLQKIVFLSPAGPRDHIWSYANFDNRLIAVSSLARHLDTG